MFNPIAQGTVCARAADPLREASLPSGAFYRESLGPNNRFAEFKTNSANGKNGTARSPENYKITPEIRNLVSDILRTGHTPLTRNPAKAQPENWFHGVRYASLSEAACAAMLEQYVPGFEAKVLETYEVPVYDAQAGVTRTIDFKIGDTFIEFHPPRFWRQGKRYGDFESADEYFAYRKALKKQKRPEDKRMFRREIQRQLTARYYKKRRAILDGDERFRDKELIVATSPEEFYSKVMKRFGKDLPSKKEFISTFRNIVKALKEPHEPSIGSARELLENREEAA